MIGKDAVASKNLQLLIRGSEYQLCDDGSVEIA